MRTYHGPVATYNVGTATQYRHSDGESLATFLSAMQRELVGQGPASSGTTAETAAALVGPIDSEDSSTHSPQVALRRQRHPARSKTQHLPLCTRGDRKMRTDF